MQSVTLLGVRVDDVTMGEAIEHIVDALAVGTRQYIVTPNPEIVLRAHSDDAFRLALNTASLAIPDGIGLLLAARLTRQRLRTRVTGVDLAVAVAREAAERGWVVGCWSPMHGIAVRALQILQEAFPGLHGHAFEKEPDRDVDVLLVGLGAPAQERWMQRQQHASSRVRATVMIGVGGALDMIAGTLPRAPGILQWVGLEWLWRLSLEPRRFPRIIRAVILFPWKVLMRR